LKHYAQRGGEALKPPIQLPKQDREAELREHYRTLHHAWGAQHWWPANTRFEVIVGAYLTQNTSWNNVEIALRSLRAAGRLSVKGIRNVSLPELEALVRSSGFFRQKASRLKLFVQFLDEKYGGSLERMFSQPTYKLRKELLGLLGVGPETADSVLLYAGQHPIFVVDTYTRRILERHGIVNAGARYDEVRTLMERALFPLSMTSTALKAHPQLQKTGHPPSRISNSKRSSLAQIFNDTHGFIVSTGKHFCRRTTPICENCPLCKFLSGKVLAATV
jgi:endonuclease-3 related protein